MKKIRTYLLMFVCLCLAALVPQGKAEAAQRLFNIVVKDGYTTQIIEMKYGKTPYGYTSYYANQSVVYVNAKSKSVTFSVKKNTSSRYGTFQFASTKIKPEEEPKGNLFTYTVDGKKRAWMFTVQKYTEPEIKYLKVTDPPKGSVYTPGKKSRVVLKTGIRAGVPAKTILRILDANDRLVYKQICGQMEAGTKTYKLTWDGKPSKGNQAKLKTSSCVPAGEYTVRITVYPQIGTKVKEVVRETKLTMGE